MVRVTELLTRNYCSGKINQTRQKLKTGSKHKCVVSGPTFCWLIHPPIYIFTYLLVLVLCFTTAWDPRWGDITGDDRDLVQWHVHPSRANEGHSHTHFLSHRQSKGHDGLNSDALTTPPCWGNTEDIYIFFTNCFIIVFCVINQDNI